MVTSCEDVGDIDVSNICSACRISGKELGEGVGDDENVGSDETDGVQGDVIAGSGDVALEELELDEVDFGVVAETDVDVAFEGQD